MPEVTDDNKNKKKTSFSFLKFGKQKENDDDKVIIMMLLINSNNCIY